MEGTNETLRVKKQNFLLKGRNEMTQQEEATA
jgi:hypothetical protein